MMKERRQSEKARLESLLRITQYQAKSAQDLLDYVLGEAIDLTQSEIGYIFFYNGKTRQFILNSWSHGVMDVCKISEPQTVFDLDKTGIWGEAVRLARPMVINDFAAPHPLKKGYPEGHAPLKRFMTVPIFSEGSIVAVLGLANKESDYLDVDIQQASLLMSSLWQTAERKRVEDALARSQQMLNQVINTLPVRIFWKDADLAYMGCNKLFARDAGLKDMAEIIGKTDDDLPWSAQADQYKADDLEVLSSGLSKVGCEEEAPSPHGGKLWMHKHKVPLKDADGKVVGILGTYEDITGIKKDQLRISRLAAIVDASEDAIIGATSDGIVTDWNGGAENIYGYTALEILGKSLLVLAPPDKQGEVTDILDDLTQGKHINHYETRHMRKSGDNFYIWLTISPIFDDHQLTGLSMIGRDVTQRKTSEAEQERYRNFIENISDGCFEIDLQGNITFANEAMEERMGYSRGGMIGVNNRLYNSPDASKRIYDIFKRIYQTGEPADINDYVVKNKLGQIRYVDLSASLIRDVNGKPVGFRGTTRDITDRKIIKDDLERSEARYRNLFQYNKAVMLLIDPDTAQIVDANLAACYYYQYSKNELLHKKITDINVLNHEEMCAEMDLARLEERSHFYFSHRLANGEIHPVEVFTGPVEIGGKQLLYSIVHDITERRKTEQALRESEERYRTILETILEGYMEHDLEGHFIFANDYACAMMGYTREELLQMNYRQIVAPQAARYMERIARDIIATGIPRKLVDYAVVRKDGTVRIHQHNLSLIRDAAGAPVGLRVMARDVTELKKIEADLRYSEERSRILFNNIPVPTFVWKAQGEQFILAEFNGAAFQFIGDDIVNFMGKTANQFFSGMPQIPADIRKCLALQKTVENQFWYAVDDRSEKRYVMVKYAFAAPDSVLMHVNDITGQKRAEENLQYISVHDSLTGLYNRFYADAEIMRMASSRLRPVSVIIIDLNDLKKVNDEYGHAHGDLYIKNAATLLQQTFRPEDMTARIGGDEFMVLLPFVDEDTCAQAVARLHENIRLFNTKNEQPISLSAGCSTAHVGDSLMDRMREADRRMYVEKANMKATGQTLTAH